MNALNSGLLVLGLFVIYFIFFKKKKEEEVIIEEKPIPLLEEEPMTNFVRPISESNVELTKDPVRIKKMVKAINVEQTVNAKKSLVKKKVELKTPIAKKKVYNEESIKTPYKNEDTMNHIAPILPIHENEPAMPLYEPTVSISSVEISNDTSFNNSNDNFGGGGAGDNY